MLLLLVLVVLLFLLSSLGVTRYALVTCNMAPATH